MKRVFCKNTIIPITWNEVNIGTYIILGALGEITTKTIVS